jgi:superfamily II DNA or RNA helicase
MSAISLRDYQLECLGAIDSAEQRGVKRQLVVLPTGTGKTVIFSHLIQQRPGRALVLAHRDELIQQAIDKIRIVNPEAQVGIVKAERNETNYPIIVASVQTLARESRLDQLPKDFRTIIVDEAHHASAASYKRVIDGLSASSDPLIVGFTATADRGDKQGLDSVFSEIVFSKDILTMIRSGYLVDIRAIQIRLANADLNRLHTRAGDFVEAELGDMLRAADIQKHAVRTYQEHAAGRKALLFTPTVLLAHDMASAFEDAGIPAAAIDGTTDIDHRREVLERFKRGDIRVLANCMVLSEGFDEPSADCILMARPTKSRSLYQQVIGRGLRTHPGKDNCLVLDFVGATTRLDLVTTATLFDIKPNRARRFWKPLPNAMPQNATVRNTLPSAGVWSRWPSTFSKTRGCTGFRPAITSRYPSVLA